MTKTERTKILVTFGKTHLNGKWTHDQNKVTYPRTKSSNGPMARPTITEEKVKSEGKKYPKKYKCPYYKFDCCHIP